MLGIEINGYAAELARLTVWITELQWQLRKGLGLTRRPILDKLDGIVRADALLTPSGGDREWPEADVVVGNPPFLGGKRMRSELGDAYVDRLFAAYAGRVPADADLVAYWFAKAWERMRDGRLKRAGLVATLQRKRSDAVPIARSWTASPRPGRFTMPGQTSHGLSKGRQYVFRFSASASMSTHKLISMVGRSRKFTATSPATGAISRPQSSFGKTWAFAFRDR